MRINRFLARSGVASRRKAEELILAGKVSLNGRIVTDLATIVDPKNDKVKANETGVRLPEYVYYALNKPAGYTCTRKDAHAARTVYQLLPNDPGLVSVGRLDRETTGLLLLTNDGQFVQNVIHPSAKIAKKYIVQTGSKISDSEIEKLLQGVTLEDGLARAITAKRRAGDSLELTLEEGRKRIVRRMIKSIGHQVKHLTRISIGEIKLDLPAGKYRPLTSEEVGLYV